MGRRSRASPPSIKAAVDTVFPLGSFTEIYGKSVRPPGNIYVLVKQDDFTTASGAKGVRFVVTDEEQPPRVEIVTYGFSAASGGTIKITCKCLAKDEAKFRPMFDASMQTLTVELGNRSQGGRVLVSFRQGCLVPKLCLGTQLAAATSLPRAESLIGASPWTFPSATWERA